MAGHSKLISFIDSCPPVRSRRWEGKRREEMMEGVNILHVMEKGSKFWYLRILGGSELTAWRVLHKIFKLFVFFFYIVLC